MRTLAFVLVLVLAAPQVAEANDLYNFLIGPVFGIRLGGPDGDRGVLGVEGGVGAGPQRLNLGLEHRGDKLFGYLELDPWFVLGGSLGLGVDSDGTVQPVIGIWEGVPLKSAPCGTNAYGTEVTLAAGYRFTGVHEVYFTVKAGVAQPFCP